MVRQLKFFQRQRVVAQSGRLVDPHVLDFAFEAITMPWRWRAAWNERSTMKKASELRAVLFDLDGVLVDTAQLHGDAWAELARSQGAAPPADLKEQVRGISRLESLKIALGEQVSRFTDTELDDLAARKNRRYLELIRQLGPADLLPGVDELFRDLETSGIKIVLCSASKNARTVLRAVGILDRFDAVADGNSYTQGKPHPDVFWTGARMAEVTPSECVVVEDAAAGITAALDGGFVAIGMGDPRLLAEAHQIIHDLRDLDAKSLREIQARFSVDPVPRDLRPAQWGEQSGEER